MVTLTRVDVLDDAQAILTGISDLEIFAIGEEFYLYAASQAGSGLNAYRLDANGTPQWIDTINQGQSWGITGQNGEIAMAEIMNQRVLLPLGGFHDQQDLQRIEADGSFGPAWKMPEDEADLGYYTQGLFVEQGDKLFFYAAQAGQSGLQMFEFRPDLEFTNLGRVEDSDQTHVAQVMDLGSVKVSGQTFLFVSDGAEQGLTSWRVTGDGTLEKADAISAATGLWVHAPTAMVGIEAGLEAYLVLASAGNSALTVVRVTPWGTLTPLEQMHDSLATRFQNVTALEHVEVNGRHFILAGGADDGISLLELALDGTLVHHQSLADQLDTTLTNVATLRAEVIGNTIQVFVGGTETGVTMFQIDLSQMGQAFTGSFRGDTIEGSWVDDILVGREGDDYLIGRHGDDVLVDGAGADTLWGGWGGDTYVMQDDDTEDVIRGFQFGWDKIDMSDYPLLYSMDRLSFVQDGHNVRIEYAGDTLVIEGAFNDPITPAMFSADDFIFY